MSERADSSARESQASANTDTTLAERLVRDFIMDGRFGDFDAADPTMLAATAWRSCGQTSKQGFQRLRVLLLRGGRRIQARAAASRRCQASHDTRQPPRFWL